MSQNELTPVRIEYLLVAYYRPEAELHTPAFNEARVWAQRNELVDDKWKPAKITPRGRALVRMLCDTPLPEPKVKFIDPRNNVVVEPL